MLLLLCIAGLRHGWLAGPLVPRLRKCAPRLLPRRHKGRLLCWHCTLQRSEQTLQD